MPKPKILVGKRVPANLLAAMAGPALTGVGPNPNPRRAQACESTEPLRNIKRATRGPGHPNRSKKRKNR